MVKKKNSGCRNDWVFLVVFGFEVFMVWFGGGVMWFFWLGSLELG